MATALTRVEARAQLRYVMAVGLLAALYVVAGRLGLLLAYHHDNVTLIWPPTGLSLVALILFGRRFWPGVFVGALLVNFSTSDPVALVGIALGNTLEAWVGALLLVRYADFRPTLERVKDVAAFLVIGALGCTLISATFGVASLWLAGSLEAARISLVWLVWWLGDVGGAICIAPLLLMLRNGDPPWRDLFRRPGYWVVLVLALVLSLLSFGGPIAESWVGLSVFLPFPLLVWAGSREGSRGAVTVSALVLLVSVVATAQEVGPFSAGDTHENLMSLWAYGIIMGTTALMLSAATAQHESAERRLRKEAVERAETERESTLLRERARLVREMHDGVGGQLVTALSMVERGRATDKELADILRNVLDDLRLVIDSLDAGTPDVFAAMGKLRARLEPALRRSGIALRWSASGTSEHVALPPEHSLHIVRIVQEAVANAIRHAAPTSLEVEISVPEDGSAALRVAICDNGRGMPRGSVVHGRGLQNMKDRAASMGGVLRVESSSTGTKIELLLAVSEVASETHPA